MPSTRGGSGVVTGCAERATPGFLPHRPWLIFGVADTGDGMDSPAATDATPKLLKASELAERWGLHRATVYRLVQRESFLPLRSEEASASIPPRRRRGCGQRRGTQGGAARLGVDVAT